MIDRGIIKWQPFNSCIEPKYIIKEINSEKNKINFPILSEEQLDEIGEKIIDVYNLKISATVKYFFNGKIFNITGKINYLNIQSKKIVINNSTIFFKQIIDIKY